MFGLIDCNNFFVSCERVFRPEIVTRPVIVLSNNDGCAVAISNEAKALGITRGVPFYKIKNIVELHNIAVFSGNHKLYGDMSSRVMATLSAMVPEIEIYSVDEAFLHMHLIDKNKLEDEGRKIVARVRRDIGIPTSLGIGPSKTLAKVAARFAKRYPAYRAVCLINTEEKRRKALELTDISDVWGIGRRLRRRFETLGIKRAIDFADMSVEQVRKIMNITGERTWRELNGIPCIEEETGDEMRQTICVSRSFAHSLTKVEELREAISSFVDIAARKLRQEGGKAAAVSVFIHTNSFRPDQEQYFNSASRTPDEPTADTLMLTREAFSALESIFRKGYMYKKAGFVINEIIQAQSVQHSLFVNRDDIERRHRLMDVIDAINSTNYIDKVHCAAVNPSNTYVNRNHMSRNYSTHLSDVIVIKTRK